MDNAQFAQQLEMVKAAEAERKAMLDDQLLKQLEAASTDPSVNLAPMAALIEGNPGVVQAMGQSAQQQMVSDASTKGRVDDLYDALVKNVGTGDVSAEKLLSLEQSKLLAEQKAALAQQKTGSKADSELTKIESNLRKERNSLPITKDTQKLTQAYQKIKAAGTDPTAAGDLSLIFNYMKVLDPGSTVREGEFATAQNAAGIPERVRAAWNKAKEGTRLDPVTRADFLNQAGKIWNTQVERQQDIDNQYSSIANDLGVNPKRVIIGFGTKAEKEPEAPGTAPAATGLDFNAIQAELKKRKGG